MITRNNHIIDVETIQSIRDFEWIAKLMASGFMHGKHISNRLGTGNEFQQYRPYVPGDDIRSVDWKMYAKTDKFFIKQSNIETEHKYQFYIDGTKSMQYEENGWTKFLFGKLLAASMMRVLANQGDHFGWQIANQRMPIGAGMRHWNHSIEGLYRAEFAEKQYENNPVQDLNISIVWISDFYMPLQEFKSTLKKFKNPKSELFLFHIMGDKEILLDFGKNTTFQDLESGEKMNVNTSWEKKEYQERLARHMNSLKNTALGYGARYEEVSLSKNVSEVLRKFFHHYQYSPL